MRRHQAGFGTLDTVMSVLQSRAVRRLTTALALTPAALVLLATEPALAAPPQQWEEADSVSALDFLLVLVLIPGGLFLVISLLALVPSMAKGEKYTPGQSWRSESEWFGGPRAGVEAVDKSEPAAIAGHDESGRGGASARW
jgi:hypothetical protein